jgi:hypothetical protein
VQKQEKNLPSAHFGLFLPSGPTVLAHFWLLSAHWTTVDHEHGHCVLENWNKTFRDQFLGRRIRLQSQKSNFRKKPFFSSIKSFFAPITKRNRYDLGRHQIFFYRNCNTRNWRYGLKGVFWSILDPFKAGNVTTMSKKIFENLIKSCTMGSCIKVVK